MNEELHECGDVALRAEVPRRGRWPITAVCLFLAALVWAVFGQTLHYEFVNFDDPTYVYENPAVTGGLSWHGVGWLFTHVNDSTWYPLTDISHQLDWQLYGSNAGGHHLTNVLLQAATAMFLFLALQKLTGRLWPAAFVAAVFAIHPLRVESVAWVTERKDVLSGLFFALTLLAWAGHVEKRVKLESQGLDIASISRGLGAGGWSSDYFLALIFFALGLLAKSMLVTLPFILLLLDYWPAGRFSVGSPASSRRRFLSLLGLFLEKVPFLLLSAASGIITILTQPDKTMVAESSALRWRIANGVTAYTDYLGHMVYPVGLAVVYSHAQTGPSIWHVGISVAIMLVITAGVLAGWRKYPYLLVGWGWYVIVLLPVVGVMQMTQNWRADRYTYLPQIGVEIFVTWGLLELGAVWRWWRVSLGIVAAVVLMTLSLGAHVQTAYWKDSVSLWQHTVTCTTGNAFADNLLGCALINQQKSGEAIPYLREALELEPDVAEPHVNLGIALVAQGNQNDAVHEFERALQINPNYAYAQCSLGDALAAQGRTDDAIQHFKSALQLSPDYGEAHYNLGLALASEGKWEEASHHYELALHLQLNRMDAEYLTAVALAGQKKWAEASGLYQQVLQQKPEFAEAQYNSGIALASQGKFTEAIQHFQKASILAAAQGNPALAESVRMQLKSCLAARPQTSGPESNLP